MPAQAPDSKGSKDSESKPRECNLNFQWNLFPLMKLTWVSTIVIYLTISISLLLLFLVAFTCSVTHDVDLVGRDVIVGKNTGFVFMGTFGYCFQPDIHNRKKSCFLYQGGQFLFQPSHFYIQFLSSVISKDKLIPSHLILFKQIKDASYFINAMKVLNMTAFFLAFFALIAGFFHIRTCRLIAGFFALVSTTLIFLSVKYCWDLARSEPYNLHNRLGNVIICNAFISGLALIIFAFIKVVWEEWGIRKPEDEPEKQPPKVTDLPAEYETQPLKDERMMHINDDGRVHWFGQ